MIPLFLFTGVLCTERWIKRFDTDVQPLIYNQNRSFRQSWWDLIIYDEEPPEEYEDLEDLDAMWNVKRWFSYHLKALKTQSLTRDDLANILLWFDRLEDEAIQLFVFDVTECDWNGDGKLGLDESHQLNYLMMNEYTRMEGDSRGTFKLWNIRFQRAMYGQKETVLNDRQLLKYFKPYQYKSMAYALAEEWHLTFDRDLDDLVSKEDYEKILNKTAYLGWEPRSGSDTFADQEFLKLSNSDSLALKTLENWLKFSKCAKKKSVKNSNFGLRLSNLIT